jgi:hypothetical protein
LRRHFEGLPVGEILGSADVQVNEVINLAIRLRSDDNPCLAQ